MKKRALISLYNKEGILELASFLVKSDWELLSTGGTAKYLRENSFPVTDVSAVTSFPECLDGRIKTLHPAIHAGLLAKRNDASHMETLDKLNLNTIDLVCVNLYPFFEKVAEINNSALSDSAASKSAALNEEIIEFIDIGGPAMLRSAAKNFRDVIVATDPSDYKEVMAGIKSGELAQEFRKRLAGKVFNLTSAYDAAIARYLLELDRDEAETATEKFEYPAFWPLSLKKSGNLRYGENSHQSAALYLHTDRTGALGSMEQLHGKELGYNNIRDLDLAWKAACAFGLEGSSICCVAVKHNTPCGIALGSTLPEAYEKTFACDPVSIFGGIIALNTVLDAATAKKLGELFLEIVIAPEFENEALDILKKKKNLRIIRAKCAPRDTKECIAVDGGLLVQDVDNKILDKWEVVTKLAPAEKDIPDMKFGMKAVTYVKSNAILIVKDCAATGIGGGQVNRIWPAVQALDRSTAAIKAASEKGGPWADAEPARVLASDAFIPFPDVIEAAAAAGIKSVIQPGGSINDNLSIEACDRLGLAMVFTGIRHFKH